MPTSGYEKPISLFVLGLILLGAAWLLTPPKDFPEDSIVSVTEGSGLYQVAEELEEQNVIRSAFWFRTFSIVLGGERAMKAGQYYLEESQNAFRIAWRILRGDHQIEAIKLTIPEGFTVKKISALFDEKFTFFDHKLFERTAKEGYLFPDTYFVPITATASSTLKLMGDNFDRKIAEVRPEIDASGRKFEDILKMASILEGEANNEKDREIVAAILWRRISIGMALQVDTSFMYVNGKGTHDLTADDLKIDSPYNSYLYRGLPPTPISNPGMESILAAARATTTPYLYFLTGKDGKMYYSKTFEEHVKNKQKYLN